MHFRNAILLLFCGGSFAFVPAVNTKRTQHSNVSLEAAAGSDRRAFLERFLVTGGVTAAFISKASPVFADESKFEDLSMPTEEEQKASEEDAMKARLARKAELQKEMARPMGIGASLQKEKEKQQGMKKSKEELREAMCEELGRGC